MTSPTLLLLVILAAFALYALLSDVISRSILTLPILFSGLGLALAEPVARHTDPALIDQGKRLLAEVTLILILFADASHVRFAKLRANWQLPARMLVIGMPLTVALGTAVAYWLDPTAGIAMALLTAAVLTPTDAALGQAIVTNHDLPLRLSQTINVESGLNDGLALPFVLLGATLASASATDFDTGALALDTLGQVVFGPLAGIAVGWIMARATDIAQTRGWMGEAAGGIVFLSTSFASYLVAEHLGGNGFIAAFVAGMTFGNCYRHDIHFITEFMDDVGQLLTMAAFLVFGALLLPEGLAHVTPRVLLLSVLFLTLVRMVPIFVSLTGSGMRSGDKLFLGWFGPRGLASILFTLIILEEYNLSGAEDLLACVTLTVGLSVILHGFTATPLARYIVGQNTISNDR
tara:strand:- start:79819 stop:81036 length:1218 start_codon:yes stop_codon:yes gene_type:complete